MANILVVDDEPDLRTIVGFRLERDGHTVTTAADGLIALELAAAYPPDLILLDVMMPHLDGFETLKRLKEDDRLRHIPVIMLTAKSDYASVLQGWNMDVENYLTKPFEIEEVAQIVTDVLGYRGQKAKPQF